MSGVNQSGGAQSSESSAQTSQTSESDDNQNTEQRSIDPKDHERALKDLHKYKSEMKRIQSEKEALLEEKRKSEEDSLARNNEFKTLYEREKAAREASEKREKGFWDSYYSSQKLSAVSQAAIKAGLRTEAEDDLNLLSLESVAIEKTDQGRVIVHGADEFVQDLKKTKPHWFGSKGAANINSGGGNAPMNGEKITANGLYAVEKKYGIRSKEYRDALELYRKQKSG